MRDIFEILRHKELQLSKLEAQIEALRVAAGIIAEEGEPISMHEEKGMKKGPISVPSGIEVESKASSGNGHKAWP